MRNEIAMADVSSSTDASSCSSPNSPSSSDYVFQRQPMMMTGKLHPIGHPLGLRANNNNNNNNGVPKHPTAVARRNARERNRVQQVNNGFNTLRKVIPLEGVKSKKLSKVETLRQAAIYIQSLTEMLTGGGGGGGGIGHSMSGNGYSFIDSNENFPTGSPSSSSSAVLGANIGQNLNIDSPYFVNASNAAAAAAAGVYEMHDRCHQNLLFAPKSYANLSAHLKLSPSGSSQEHESPQSSSFGSGSTDIGGAGSGYEYALSPPEVRQYAQGDGLLTGPGFFQSPTTGRLSHFVQSSYS